MVPKRIQYWYRLGLAGLALAAGIGALAVVLPSAVMAQDTNTVERRRELLQKELDQVQQEIQQNQELLSQKRQEARSVERDIEILEAEIHRAQLNIQQKEIRIQQLGRGISDRTETIEELNQKIGRSQGSLARLIRETNELDDLSLVEVMLRHDDLSDFFVQLDNFQQVQSSLNTSIEHIRKLQQQHRQVRQSLNQERDEVQDAKAVIEEEKRKIEQKEAEKQELLAIKRSEEQTYESLIEQRQRRAQQIRSALFALRDTSAIPFGRALEYANQAQEVTGVRPAFLLAILQQESALGENVGTCNRPGDAQSWRDIMPGPEDKASGRSWRDDQTEYKRIVSALDYDHESMPLSCPWQNGWGGAMGPAQFIPTTWAQYEGRIAQSVGAEAADPWDPEHAFMASALYLNDLGAGAGGYTAERRAALKYYAGSNWNLPQNSFYGDQVMNRVQDIQQNMIDPLQELN